MPTFPLDPAPIDPAPLVGPLTPPTSSATDSDDDGPSIHRSSPTPPDDTSKLTSEATPVMRVRMCVRTNRPPSLPPPSLLSPPSLPLSPLPPSLLSPPSLPPSSLPPSLSPALTRLTSRMDGQTALHRAASACQYANVALLLQYDPELANMKDLKGNTALHVACSVGHKQTVKTLLVGGWSCGLTGGGGVEVVVAWSLVCVSGMIVAGVWGGGGGVV